MTDDDAITPADIRQWWEEIPARQGPPPIPATINSSAPYVAARRALVVTFQARNIRAIADQDAYLCRVLGLPFGWELRHLTPDQCALVVAALAGSAPRQTGEAD